jgi:uncharacterized membrane protein (DUF373 family)
MAYALFAEPLLKEVSMLIVSLALFTIAALVGIFLAKDVFAGKSPFGLARFTHVGLACVGSVLVIVEVFRGDQRLWINIGLAVVIIALGGLIWYLRSKGEFPRKLVLAHGGLAVVCYLVLAYFAFNPR